MYNSYAKKVLSEKHLPINRCLAQYVDSNGELDVTSKLDQTTIYGVTFYGQLTTEDCLYHCNNTVRGTTGKVLQRVGIRKALMKGMTLNLSCCSEYSIAEVTVNADNANNQTGEDFKYMNMLAYHVQSLITDLFHVLATDVRDLKNDDTLASEAVAMFFDNELCLLAEKLSAQLCSSDCYAVELLVDGTELLSTKLCEHSGDLPEHLDEEVYFHGISLKSAFEILIKKEDFESNGTRILEVAGLGRDDVLGMLDHPDVQVK